MVINELSHQCRTPEMVDVKTKRCPCGKPQPSFAPALRNAGEVANSPFVALLMERAIGTLKRRRKRSPAPDDILKLAFAMACTLALLNEIGMIHGDLKPANILLGDGGWPLVADYGCAVILDDFIAYDIATSLGPGHKVRVQAFTRSYAAPEVRNGRLADGELYGTPQSDIYSCR